MPIPMRPGVLSPRGLAELRLTAPLLRRGRTPGLRSAKTVLAAVLAYVVASAVSTSPGPVLAPLTALLVVQLTLYETARSGLRRVLAVVAGVLVAIGFSAAVGLTWWSLGVLVAASLVVGRLLRLGSQLLEVPISAMLVLAVGGAPDVAVGRVYETLIGAGVGVLVNAVVAPPLYVQPAGDAIGELADRMAGFLRGVAADVEHGWSVEQADRWLDGARALSRETLRADRVLDQAEESLRLNPRRHRAAQAPASLRSGLAALERSVVAVREVCRSLADRARATGGDSPYDATVRDPIARLLAASADVFGAFGAVVAPDVTGPTRDDTELREALDRARTAREALPAVLAVDPLSDVGTWGTHGALLAAVDRLLYELDPETGPAARGVRRTAVTRRRVDDAVRDLVAVRRRRPAEPPS